MTDISFEEIEPLFDMLPSFDQAAAEPDQAGPGPVDPEAGPNGGTPNLIWLSGWQGRSEPQLDRPRIAIFAGLHPKMNTDGNAASDIVKNRVELISSASAEVYDLCSALDADMRLYEMGVATARPDTLDETTASRALAYGMMAVEDGIDILGLGAVSPGLEEPATQLVQAIEKNNQPPTPRHMLALLCDHGSEAIAGMIGAILAARLAKTPVLLDGLAALSAGLLVHTATTGGADHCRLACPVEGFSESPVIANAFGTAVCASISVGEGDGAAHAVSELRHQSGWV